MNIYKSRMSLLACLLFMAAFHTLAGQSMPYHPFPNRQVSLFYIGTPAPIFNQYAAVRIDSVVPDGVDSLFHLYRTMRLPNPADSLLDCQGHEFALYYHNAVLPDQDHKLGRYMRLKPYGDCEFVYSNGDTFLLQTQASIGQTWAWSPGVTATVDTILWEPVLQQLDSVKYIVLSSGKLVKLGRNLGLVQAHPFHPAADQWGNLDTLDIHLAGIPKLGLGMQLPGFEALYRYQIGDRWEHATLEGNLASQSYGNGYMYDVQITDTIPGTHYQYQILYTAMFYYRIPGQSVYGPVLQHGFDTIGFDSTAFDPVRHLLPGEWNQACECGMTAIRSGQQFNGRLTYDIYSTSDFDTCAMAYRYSNVQTTVEGVGNTIWYLYYDGGDFHRQDLTCFVLGTETWGTCQDYHALEVPAAAETQDWTLAPNPAYDLVRLRARPSGEDRVFTLMAADGRILKLVTLPANSEGCEISMDGFATGLYWLKETGGKVSTILLGR